MKFESLRGLKALLRIHSYSEENNEPKGPHKAHTQKIGIN